MKVLVATSRTQGALPNDFSFCVEGELVLISNRVCDRGVIARDDCGCARGFTGLNSRKATTTAEVREVDLSYEDVLEAVRSSLQQAGWDDPSEALGFVAGVLEEAAAHPVGTVVERDLDVIRERRQLSR